MSILSRGLKLQHSLEYTAHEEEGASFDLGILTTTGGRIIQTAFL